MADARRHPPGTPVWVNLETVAGTTAASRFYGALFGWTALARHRPTEDSSHWWVFLLDGRDVASMAPGPAPRWAMYMSVDNIDESARLVVDSGGAIAIWPEEIDEVSRLALCIDPDGGRFGLWEPKTHRGASRMHVPISFTWGELTCRDVDAARRFYGAVFGWEVRSGEFVLPAGDRPVAGVVQADGARRSQWMISFAVHDPDEIAARTVQLGGSVSVAPADQPDKPDQRGRTAVLTDPEGAVFSVVECQ